MGVVVFISHGAVFELYSSDEDDQDCGVTWQEVLIQLVKNEPHLYEKANSDYANSDIKETTWTSIAQKMNDMGFGDIKGIKVGKIF